MALTPEAVYALALATGLDRESAIIATAIAWGESGLNPDAVGDEDLADDTWGPSTGLWQIRSLRSDRGTGGPRDELANLDPKHNAMAMFVISGGGRTWTPWTIYKTGAYLRHLDAVRAAVSTETGVPPMKFVSRDEWGARTPRSITGSSMAQGVAVHWEGPHMGWPWPHSQCAGKVRGIQDFHMDSRGWADIAYNDLVCGHGYVFEGRGPNVRNAANGGNGDDNATHMAICYLAGEDDEFTDEARDAINDAAERLGVAGGDWRPHRYFTETACPGDEIASWLELGHPRSTGPEPAPTPQPEEPEVAKIAYPRTIEAGDGRRRIPVPAIGGGFGWKRVAVNFATADQVTLHRPIIGPYNERPLIPRPADEVNDTFGFSGRAYADLAAGDEWIEIEVSDPPTGALELMIEASDG